MEYLVHMKVELPSDLSEDAKDKLLQQEREYSHELQRAGKWTGLWRVVGEWANYSVLDVDDNTELNDILSGLPLYPYLELTITPLADHPSWLGLPPAKPTALRQTGVVLKQTGTMVMRTTAKVKKQAVPFIASMAKSRKQYLQESSSASNTEPAAKPQPQQAQRSEMTEQNQRVTKVAEDIIDAIKDRLAANDVTHQEFMAAVQFMGKVAGSGEMPLFMMVFFEAAVERITFDHKPGTKGAVQGPYHREHDKLDPPYVLPMRDDEPGDAIVFSGKITDLDGNALAGVSVDTWQAGNDGTYSGFNPVPPENNLRGIMETDENGEFCFASIRPAPYQIPHSGPTGEFLLLIGQHAWRPAHFHFKLNKEGFDPLTTQIYFEGDEIIEGQGDIVDGVKDELIVTVGEGSDPDVAATYGVSVPYQTAEYAWRLRPSG